MKKLTALFLIFALIFGLSACVRDEVSSGFSQNSTPKINDSGKSFSGKIVNSSNFSHGLALVCVEGDGDKTYCINKKGNIVYEIKNNKDFPIGNLDQLSVITDSHILYDNVLYDLNGKSTAPEDVGVTKFYGIALEGGYILAENIVADFNSTRKELCVFDTNFNLIVQPSEELYSALEESLDSTGATAQYIVSSLDTSSYSYYYNDYLYFHQSNCYLHLKTGEITYEAPFDIPSSQWARYSDYYVEQDNNNEDIIRLDLREYDNIHELGGFKNGKAIIKFYNQDIDDCFFTLIDEQGNFQFEPILVRTRMDIYYDGFDTILIRGNPLKSYNAKGELLGELEIDSMNKTYYFSVSDGVIRIHTSSTSSNEVSFYNPDLTPLF